MGIDDRSEAVYTKAGRNRTANSAVRHGKPSGRQLISAT